MPSVHQIVCVVRFWEVHPDMTFVTCAIFHHVALFCESESESESGSYELLAIVMCRVYTFFDTDGTDKKDRILVWKEKRKIQIWYPPTLCAIATAPTWK